MAKKKSKWKKIAKNVGKAAVLAGALYGASKLGKKSGVVGVRRPGDSSMPGNLGDYGFKTPRKWNLGGIEGPPSLAAKGGRIGKKGGGRTGKQFGGGLNRRVAGPVGGVGAPVRPMAYKHGGKVKSMGIAKRGGGVAKR